jgi:hypothetical protein
METQRESVTWDGDPNTQRTQSWRTGYLARAHPPRLAFPNASTAPLACISQVHRNHLQGWHHAHTLQTWSHSALPATLHVAVRIFLLQIKQRLPAAKSLALVTVRLQSLLVASLCLFCLKLWSYSRLPSHNSAVTSTVSKGFKVGFSGVMLTISGLVLFFFFK